MEMSRSQSDRRWWVPRARSLLVGLGACMLTAAAPAWAARVVEVRVGQHPGFSRVVFELDSSVGYKVERSTTASGTNELVISIDAAAEAQTVDSKLDFIETLEIVPRGGNQSIVRVRLKGKNLRLKEMILANPPRIVLDVLSVAAIADARAKTAAVAKVEEPKPAPKPRKPAETAKIERDKVSVMPAPQPPASLPADTDGNRRAVKRELAMAAKPRPSPAVIPAPQKPPAAKVPSTLREPLFAPKPPAAVKPLSTVKPLSALKPPGTGRRLQR